MIFIGKISKGHNSVKNVYGIRVLVFCTSSDDVNGVKVLFPAHPLMVVSFVQSFMKYILDGIKVIERT